jgi:hypothetical protein
VVVALATLPFALATAHTPEWWLVATVVLRGIGLGAVTIPVMASAYIGLDQTVMADASIITRTARQIGRSFGIAVLAVVLERAIAQHASAGLRGVAAGFDVAFWWSIAFTAVAIVLALWLPARSIPSRGNTLLKTSALAVLSLSKGSARMTLRTRLRCASSGRTEHRPSRRSRT